MTDALLRFEAISKRFGGTQAAATAATSRSPFIHQDVGRVEWMTVAENVGLGMGYPRRYGLIDWRAAGRRGPRATCTHDFNA